MEQAGSVDATGDTADALAAPDVVRGQGGDALKVVVRQDVVRVGVLIPAVTRAKSRPTLLARRLPATLASRGGRPSDVEYRYAAWCRNAHNARPAPPHIRRASRRQDGACGA